MIGTDKCWSSSVAVIEGTGGPCDYEIGNTESRALLYLSSLLPLLQRGRIMQGTGFDMMPSSVPPERSDAPQTAGNQMNVLFPCVFSQSKFIILRFGPDWENH